MLIADSEFLTAGPYLNVWSDERVWRRRLGDELLTAQEPEVRRRKRLQGLEPQVLHRASLFRTTAEDLWMQRGCMEETFRQRRSLISASDVLDRLNDHARIRTC